ncbi:MAG: hypothetical protein ACI9SC_002779 [Gammaproteobacteria bacterium]|jgi:hypothetical protein
MRMANKKVIARCAVAGSDHTPSLSPYLPYKPKDIAQQAIDTAQTCDVGGRKTGGAMWDQYEMASLNMGTINFGMSPMAGKERVLIKPPFFVQPVFAIL